MPFDQATTAWLCTTASQIFFMQLGFLCYEVGFVQPVWTQSVILKNIEDTFVGVLTFLAFGFTLSESSETWHGVIAIPSQPLLIGVSTKVHDQILISAFFASTCATIISGAVLERMKNKAYIIWCLLTILVNYSFISHWVWHSDGWLEQMGFVDGAGSVVVHTTAGMSALVAVWKLGDRTESDNIYENRGCIRVARAARPIIHAVGAFFLWYGWFAFNVASPIAYSRGIGDAVGTTALVTVVSPICSCSAAFLWMTLNIVPLDFESLLNCLLAGLVSITGMCHTVDVWSAVVVGFFASAVYFSMAYVVRVKWNLDDPLQVITIHLFCGIYSGVLEGVVANDTYGRPGLIRGNAEHFGVQILGVAVIVAFNFVVSFVLWELILVRLAFHGDREDIRVSILDIYLGTRLFDQNYDMALDEVLNCRSNAARKMLYQFHRYVEDRYASEQLDFLIVTKIFHRYLSKDNDADFDALKSAAIILQIIATYVDAQGRKCINVSGTQRSILMKIRNQLIFELKEEKITSSKGDQANEIEMKKMERMKVKEKKGGSGKRASASNHSHSLIKYQAGFYKSGMDITKENVFDAVYKSVWKIVIPHFAQFLKVSFETDREHRFNVKIPFHVEENWNIEWDEDLLKESAKHRLLDTVPQTNDDGALLNKIAINAEENEARTKTVDAVAETVDAAAVDPNKQESDYPIVFVTDQTKKDHENEAVVVIE